MSAPSDLLDCIGFAGDLTATSQVDLLSKLEVMKVPAGTDILHPGDAVDGVYFVRAGSLRIYYIDERGHEGTLYWIEPGESCILALNSLFTEVPYPAFAAAEGDGAEIVSVSGCIFREIFAHEPAAQKFLFEQLSARVFALLRTLEQKMRLPQETQLILLLIDKADQDGTVQLSQDRIARHLGTVREVISRLLKNLASQGLIETGHGLVRITNRSGLEAIASSPNE